MPRTVSNAFTLIELLVVIAIMAVIGVFTLANYRSFGEDQNLKNAVLDVQSMLRAAQTNAISNVVCNTQYGATWKVEFSNTTTVVLKCREPSGTSFTKKTLTLGSNIAINSVSGTPSVSCPTVPPFTPFTSFTIYFDPLDGKICLGTMTNCTLLTITLINSKTTNTKSLVIEQGGRIYAP